jgi:ADP-ribosyl-[dinitrogen reductase] hydrolase
LKVGIFFSDIRKPANIKKVYKEYTFPKSYEIDKILSLEKDKKNEKKNLEKHLKHLRELGIHSDDTQQALGLIHCIIDSLNNKDKEFIDIWADFNKKCYLRHKEKGNRAWRDFGQNFSNSLEKLLKGVDPKSVQTETSGIGAAMRTSPISCFF